MHREFFPVTRNLIYLNHAAVTPLCRPAAEAMQGLAQDALDWGSLHYDRWLECYEGLRLSAARLVNATPGEIAIVIQPHVHEAGTVRVLVSGAC